MEMSLLEKVDWRKAARELCEKIRLEQLHPRALCLLEERIEEPWCIACSGGADSLSLLLLVYGYFFSRNKKISVFHYNHKLRGAESDGEEEFVKECCRSLGVPIICGEGDGLIEDRSEANLRKRRHGFFEESLKKVGGKMLLLGHHRDDVAEMMLMRIARGSGTGGVCATRAVQFFKNGKIHVRLLLNLGKRFILDKLEEVGIAYCVDSSNEREYYFRNRVRKNVIPEWEAAFLGDLGKGITRSRELFEEDDVALEEWLESIIGIHKLKKGEDLEISLLEGKPKALYRRALHKWLQINGIDKHFNTKSFDRFLERVMGGEGFEINVGDEKKVVAQDGVIKLEKLENEGNLIEGVEREIGPGDVVEIESGKFLRVEAIKLDGVLKNRIFKGEIDTNYEVYLRYEEDMRFGVRSWKAGDRYQPIGSSGRKKLQDMFTDRKIAREKRYKLPIIYEKELGIVWCPGLPIAEAFKVEEDTICALKLTYR
ncbi:MAG: tRNA lysidine(34) synthetase TilS [Verrucomicrobia bacterium]|nr:MAG: tRNA lysidine(34) synthetase TilS [Verrucomicrobiota bacterium]